MQITVYRGGTGGGGVPLLETVIWLQDESGENPEGVDLPPSLNQPGKWVFVSGSGLLSDIPSTPATRDAMGNIVDPGGPAKPINPYTAPVRAGVTLLAYADYVSARNNYIDQLEAAGEYPGISRIDPAAPPPLYVGP